MKYQKIAIWRAFLPKTKKFSPHPRIPAPVSAGPALILEKQNPFLRASASRPPPHPARYRGSAAPRGPIPHSALCLFTPPQPHATTRPCTPAPACGGRHGPSWVPRAPPWVQDQPTQVSSVADASCGSASELHHTAPSPASPRLPWPPPFWSGRSQWWLRRFPGHEETHVVVPVLIARWIQGL
jgi:hypothetical protein